MRLRLFSEIPCINSPLISYESSIVMVGSCFVTYIGAALADYRFKILANPYGVLYNPLSIERLFDELDTGRRYNEEDLFYHNGLWNSEAHHSSFSHHDKGAALDKINTSIESAATALQKADIIIVTWGSAWIYTRENRVLANCHKLPASEIKKRILQFDEVRQAIHSVAARYPGKTVIHTVSPIRHLKDGFSENARSKALLIAALHEAVEGLANNRYFPSYELMIDSLRDYRFYEEDMLHPSEQALRYIRDFFFETNLRPETLAQTSEIGRLLRDLRHRPFRPDSSEAMQFLLSLRERLIKYNGIGTGFSAEIARIDKQIEEAGDDKS